MMKKTALIACVLGFSSTLLSGHIVCLAKYKDKQGMLFSKVSFNKELCRQGHGGHYRFKMRNFNIFIACNGNIFAQVEGPKSGFIRRSIIKKKHKHSLIRASTPKAANTVLSLRCSQESSVEENFFDVKEKPIW